MKTTNINPQPKLHWSNIYKQVASTFNQLLSSETSVIELARLRNVLTRMILIRVLVLSTLLGSTAWGFFTTDTFDATNTLFWIIAITFAVSLLNLILLKRYSHHRSFGYLQLSVDVILATLAISVTSSTVCISLYLMIIIAASMLYSGYGAVIIAAFSGLCYALLLSNLFPLLSNDYPMATTPDILAVYISLITVALISGYLTRQLELVGLLANTTAKNLSELNEQQKQLFNDISEGIITLDLHSAITGINQAARSILGLSQLDANYSYGRPLRDVLKEHGLANTKIGNEEFLDFEQTEEITFKRPQSNDEVKLRYSLRRVADREGNEIGRILTFNDVSHMRSMEERLQLHEQMAKLLAEVTDDNTVSQVNSSTTQMVGESLMMKRVSALVDRVSASEAAVLISGESGTGKELIAKAVHSQSSRRQKPFVAINCGAIPENLLESELFGHKKGSFTGAINDNLGLFRQAQGGTIFLDEIGELPLPMQTKLLRALQEKTIRPVGDVRDIAIDVRIIAATNRDLRKEISNHKFREDLFYRLNVINIVVPPLRERKEDIPLLVRHFMSKFCDPDKVLPQISPEALQLLMSYNFPGNIRELENMIERALVLGGQAILPENLPVEVAQHSGKTNYVNGSEETKIILLPINLEEHLEEFEKQYLIKALEESGGIKKNAAKLLGLNFRSFRYRLKKFGLSDSDSIDSDDNS